MLNSRRNLLSSMLILCNANISQRERSLNSFRYEHTLIGSAAANRCLAGFLITDRLMCVPHKAISFDLMLFNRQASVHTRTQHLRHFNCKSTSFKSPIFRQAYFYCLNFTIVCSVHAFFQISISLFYSITLLYFCLGRYNFEIDIGAESTGDVCI